MGKKKKQKARSEKAGVLSDHQRIGKRFIPPLLQLGNLEEVEWVELIIPEVLWLGLLNAKYGLKRGAALGLSLSRTAANCADLSPRVLFADTSAYALLTADQQTQVIDVLKSSGELAALREALCSLDAFYPECPLNFIFEGAPPSADDPHASLSELKSVLDTLFNHQGKPATLVQANVVYIAFITDMLKVVEGLTLANFPAVAEFPDTEESRRVAAGVRAAVNGRFGHAMRDKVPAWPRYFWNRGLELEPCSLFSGGAIKEANTQKQFWAAVDRYVNQVREELTARWKGWAIDLTTPEMYEVIGGLMARQVTLATQLAEAPSIWNGHVAPLILRTMTDTYITFAWIFDKPLERSRKFILHGLGQEKLLLEHLKAQIEATDKNVDKHPLIKQMEEWLNSQRLTYLMEVNVGSWSGIDARKMAKEADCLDLYRFSYVPFSAAIHSMWHHIVRYNLKRCLNPLHQYHRVPVDSEASVDVDYLYRAAEYVKKTFDLFDQKTGITVGGPSAFETFVNALNCLASQETEDSHGNDMYEDRDKES